MRNSQDKYVKVKKMATVQRVAGHHRHVRSSAPASEKVPTALTAADRAPLASHPAHFPGPTPKGDFVLSTDPSLPSLVRGCYRPPILVDQRRYIDCWPVEAQPGW